MTTFVLSDTQLNIIKKQGEFFGYPKCCVRAFVCRVSGKKTQDKQLKAAHAGFIPCPKHADNILKKEVDIGDLIQKKRLCPIAFNKEKISIYEIEWNKSLQFQEWFNIVENKEKFN